MPEPVLERIRPSGLNESPSEKEGKFSRNWAKKMHRGASMKALPKRKGNADYGKRDWGGMSLNESPSEKEGK